MLKHDIWVHPEFLAFYHHRVTADGDMGNSVHTGNHLHALYRQMLRNKWIRDGVNDPTTSGRMGLMLAMEIQDSLAKTFNKRDTRRKYKSPIRQALSDGVKRIKKYFAAIFRRGKPSYFANTTEATMPQKVKAMTYAVLSLNHCANISTTKE